MADMVAHGIYVYWHYNIYYTSNEPAGQNPCHKAVWKVIGKQTFLNH